MGKSALKALEVDAELETGKEEAKDSEPGSDLDLPTSTTNSPGVSHMPNFRENSTQGQHDNRRVLPPPPAQGVGREMANNRFQLELELGQSQRAALNQGTSANYNKYLESYQEFCRKYGYKDFPLSEISVSMFAQYLSRTVKPQTIKQAVSALRTVSVTVGFKIPERQFPLITLTLRGIGNLNPAPPKRVHPMTVRILLNIRENLNLSDPFESTMWALFTTCFFLLFRKSNVTLDKFWEDKFMRREHIQKTVNGFLITLYWTKTIQTGDRSLQFPLLAAPGSAMCPVWAIKNMIKRVPAPPDAPAFCYSNGFPIMYHTYNSFLKKHIRKLGLSDIGWSTHSFRRGGSSYLAACGVPDRQIQILGDWKSDCYKQYIHCPWQEKLSIANKIKTFLMNAVY